MKKTMREKLMDAWDNIPYEKDGKVEEEALICFRNYLFAKAEKWEELSPESYDSPVRFYFEDGSDIDLANPRQRAFMAFLS